MGTSFPAPKDGPGHEVRADHASDALTHPAHCDGCHTDVSGTLPCDPSKGCSFVSLGEALMSLDRVDYTIMAPFEVWTKKHTETWGVDVGDCVYSAVSFVSRAGSIHDLVVSDVVSDSAWGRDDDMCEGSWWVVVCDGSVGEVNGTCSCDSVV